MTASLVVVEDLVKRFGDGPGAIQALQGVGFAVAEREFVSITGPSGCGTSTLLNLIAGLDEPTSGRIVIAGRDLRQLSVDARSDLRLRQIGFVFQAFNLLPTFTALENVALPLELLGIGWREATLRAGRALDRVGMPATAHDRWPSDLSGGEQQRVAIARAIVTEPPLVLADEPTGNLDSKTGRTILDLLSALNRSSGVTVVMVTHSTLAATYGDRTLEIEDGRIVRDVRVPAAPRLHGVNVDDG